MNRLLLITILFYTGIALAASDHGHDHDTNNSNITVNQTKYDNFVNGLSNVNIAIVDVKGMVCDFCARGIEKTFYDDKAVKKVDVDLNAGKVLVAYLTTKIIDIEEIKNIFLINGQTATNVIVKKL